MAEGVLHLLRGRLLEDAIFAKYRYLMCAMDSPANADSRLRTVTDSGLLMMISGCRSWAPQWRPFGAKYRGARPIKPIE
jgi:hypothetical protein